MKRRHLLLLVVLTAALGTSAASLYARRKEPTSSFRTEAVRRTDIVATITATGTVVPEDVVDVGAQVNGQIASFGNDTQGQPVDFGSTVTAGMVLARIDDALYAADVATAQAQLAQAHAQVQVGEANLAQAKARSEQTQHDWERAQQLEHSPALAQADFDAARSANDQALAAVALAQASIVQGQAAVSMAEASVTRAQRNLAYCTIHSPVDGVILDRRVEIGQTVVASLNAPSLFLIAKDLRRMRVLVQVNEADIEHVKAGADVTFTADALPGETLHGTVRKVRLNATLTQNVVTYTVEIAADNSKLALLPYLTANVTFEIARREHVLTVPNAALRWAPHGVAAEPTARGASNGATVWVEDNGKPHPIAVHAGLSDGTSTEIESDELGEGRAVIVGELATASAKPTDATNPFTPQLRGGRSGR